jgi:AraC-like DNA-binding protein
LLQVKSVNTNGFREKLIESGTLNKKIEIISDLIRELINAHKVTKNDAIQKAISIIIAKAGKIKVKALCESIYMTERSLERNFLAYVGLSPKQFAKIIQFQSSINKLSQSTYNSLLNIGLDSGFSDQSHFIRTFKSYTGQTPSYYLNQLKEKNTLSVLSNIQ